MGPEDHEDEQAAQLYALWMARRLNEPEALRARANLVATAAFASGLSSLLTLLGMADRAPLAIGLTASSSTILFLLCIYHAYSAILAPFDTTPQPGLTSSELIDRIRHSSNSESKLLRPKIRRATCFGVVGLAVSLLAIITVSVLPETKEPSPEISVALTPRALELIPDLEDCVGHSGRLRGTLLSQTSGGLLIDAPRSDRGKCTSGSLWLKSTDYLSWAEDL